MAAVCLGVDTWLSRGANPRHARRVVCASSFLLSLAVYVYCLAPGLAGDDTAEYALQAYRLGLAHIGGYPFYLMIGRLFEAPFPASPVFGLNLMSAVFSAAAVAMVALIVSREGYGERVALALAMQFAFVPPFWSQAVITEVHNVSTAVSLALILGLLAWRDRGAPIATGAVLCLLAGLATGVYFPIILIAPALFLFIACAPGTRHERALRVLTSAAAFLVGLAVVAAVIISKARHDPPLGTVIVPVDLWSYYQAVTGKQEDLVLPGTIQMLSNLSRLPVHYFRCWLGLTFLAGIAGAIRPVTLAALPTRLLLVLIILANAGYVYALQPTLWFLMTNTAYAAFAIVAAGGYAWVLGTRTRWAGLTARVLPITPALGLFLFHSGLVVPINSGYVSVDRRDERRFDEFSDRVLATMPPDAAVLAPWEFATAIQYKQTVFGQRSDLRVYELRDGVTYGAEYMKSWRDYVRLNIGTRPVFIGVDDPGIRQFADLAPAGDRLWRVVPHQTDPSPAPSPAP